ncbi:uncharacterized protein LOC132901778 [Amyelois transitella]|uniref:uncharacterized protein LOC132901778 n=1 Tax=Amyelois transitella TaxID=680683 RepID=UPI00298F921B|nr:uncharacterized protein LOC132901778 [Amyelois transitella]
MSTIIGNLTIFDHKIHEWEVFYGKLTQFIKLNNISVENQSAVLLTNLSDESYRLVRGLVHPNKLEESNYSELVKLLNTHFTPKRSTFVDRAKFYDAVKSDGESIEDWAARLRGLAVYCDFGPELHTVLRDRFVLGFGTGRERDRLFEADSKTLTLAQAMEIAQKAACVRQARASVAGGAGAADIKEESVFYAGDHRRAGGGAGSSGRQGGGRKVDDNEVRCAVCGYRNHDGSKCRFKNYKCLVCGQKGHLKRMCVVKKSNVHNIVPENVGSDREDCSECELFNMRYVVNKPIKLSVRINDQWGERQEEAFKEVKRILASERVLAHFDPSAPLVLTVDAGPAGLGAVLAHQDANGRERPIAFASRSLSKSEKNYSQIQKEATAIIFGVRHIDQIRKLTKANVTNNDMISDDDGDTAGPDTCLLSDPSVSSTPAPAPDSRAPQPAPASAAAPPQLAPASAHSPDLPTYVEGGEMSVMSGGGGDTRCERDQDDGEVWAEACEGNVIQAQSSERSENQNEVVAATNDKQSNLNEDIARRSKRVRKPTVFFEP